MRLRALVVCLALVLLSFYDSASAQVPDNALKYKRYLKRAALNLWGLDAPTARGRLGGRASMVDQGDDPLHAVAHCSSRGR